ncbi:gamma-glutamylcyclotransferase [Microbacterium sp. APC 3898]|uniref:Gamma-glutamylcyclotransferase n=1 Tax=Planococcus notacanthi TaxID=3035188 RepID=A0ABT7ZJ09_9BACL|nr:MULTISPECIES: gamma-glutamylcyclotransferase family protein [Terrabacteria group]MDN3427146.1 gamma-glutamylcyclotransferase [Planococcus sp. APC 4016]MDN3499425.1 gamma-glutamylcyclotransferase [Microbacterium sp. APC 3898]
MLLFAYGTLKQGGKYHCYLEEAELVEEQATAKGTLYDTGMGYPAMVLSDNGQVEGEIYEIPDVLWPALDYLEDYSGNPETDLYEKVTITVQAGSETLETLVYLAKDEKILKQQISTGTWDVVHSVV